MFQLQVEKAQKIITEAECEKDGKKLRGYDGRTYSRFGKYDI